MNPVLVMIEQHRAIQEQVAKDAERRIRTSQSGSTRRETLTRAVSAYCRESALACLLDAACRAEGVTPEQVRRAAE